ncbi:hypothetical protein BDV12DRAFT_195474 [Aspergillus spectabilis]
MNSHPAPTPPPMLNPASLEAYTIAWICALDEEYVAAYHMLDKRYPCPAALNGKNTHGYIFGSIGGHYIVIARLLPGRPGDNSAARVGADVSQIFPNLRFAVLVGIGGGAPSRKHDIRLGDVVVSQPQGVRAGVVNCGQRVADFKDPPLAPLNVLMEMIRQHNDVRFPDQIAQHLRRMDGVSGFQRPRVDLLFESKYRHVGGGSCGGCSPSKVVKRPERRVHRSVPAHYGTIGSVDYALTYADARDRYAQDPKLNILCFDMEAAGLSSVMPSLVVRGISNYCDSHKNDDWRGYAALAAAAYTRELLLVLKPQQVKYMPDYPPESRRMPQPQPQAPPTMTGGRQKPPRTKKFKLF